MNNNTLTTATSYGRITRVKTTTKKYLNGKLIEETIVETDYEKEDYNRFYPTYPTYPTYPSQPYIISYTTSSAKLNN